MHKQEQQEDLVPQNVLEEVCQTEAADLHRVGWIDMNLVYLRRPVSTNMDGHYVCVMTIVQQDLLHHLEATFVIVMTIPLVAETLTILETDIEAVQDLLLTDKERRIDIANEV